MTRLILKLKDSLKIEKLKDLKNRKCFSQMKKYYVNIKCHLLSEYRFLTEVTFKCIKASKIK